MVLVFKQKEKLCLLFFGLAANVSKLVETTAAPAIVDLRISRRFIQFFLING
jgi:hypothetical protein